MEEQLPKQKRKEKKKIIICIFINVMFLFLEFSNCIICLFLDCKCCEEFWLS